MWCCQTKLSMREKRILRKVFSIKKKKNYTTTTANDGYPIYRQRDNGASINKNGMQLDNRYAISHNRHLLLKYGAHINVEWCNQSRAIKNLFKYVNKGHDHATSAFS